MSRDRCSRCRFWDHYGENGEFARDKGDCRRQPPRLSDELIRRHLSPPTYGMHLDVGDEIEVSGLYAASAFPITHETSWCGEFAARGEEMPFPC